MRNLFLVILCLPVFCTNAVQASDDPQPQHIADINEILLSQPLFSQFETEHFLIVHDLENAAVQKLSGILEHTYKLFFKVYGQIGFELNVPNEKLIWVCFTKREQFRHYISKTEKMDLSWLSSYYSSKTNRVTILMNANNSAPKAATAILAVNTDNYNNGNLDNNIKIGHELAHQLAFNTGLQKRRVMYPLWVSEGLATMFETHLSGQPGRVRYEQLTKIAAMGELLPLGDFVSMTRLPADATSKGDIYAQTQGLFEFLIKHHNRQLKSYLHVLAKLDPGWRSQEALDYEFTNSFGQVSHLDQEWVEYASARRAEFAALSTK